MKLPISINSFPSSVWQWPIVRFSSNLAFVPSHQDPDEEQIQALKHLMMPNHYDIDQDPRKILVVTGAGISTESGLQDYRSVPKYYF